MLTKKFFKSKPSVCKVTFQLPADIKAKKVNLVGEFNDWNKTAKHLKKIRGVWKTSIELDKDREYQFRYLVNGTEWHNDDTADKYVHNSIDGDNSVVVTARD